MASDSRHAEGDQLNSWKEIAQHLRVSVRTAMRWERPENLPAHRHKHKRLSSVYAYKSELDQWWNNRPALKAEAGHALAPSDRTSREASVAVLPFVDLTSSEDGGILADGLTEELITLLSQVPGLHVVARTSSFFFKGKAVDIRTIAQQLGVSNLVEGSIRLSGSRIRVSAQLINAADGFHLWSDHFDRPLENLLDIQNSIARAITR